jgi:sulfide dehydrogenase [flavocytochrome c] flavoprotein subunit
MDKKLTRRGFIKISGLSTAALASGVVGEALAADKKGPMVNTRGAAELPKATGPRVVVVGGGTSGLTIAKYLKKEHSKFDVVLVEKRQMYSSCFSSNLWYADLINLEFIAAHSFLDAARNNGYTFFNATCTGVDRHSKTLHTNEGAIRYDYLVIAPGIDYDYGRVGVTDVDKEYALRTGFPGGFAMPTEHVSIRDKIRGFEGGVFVQTVPSGNYRCLPAPYERACMIASVFKKNKIPGKVLLLDHNPDIVIKAKGFHAAFDELYKGIIEYVKSAEINDIDPEKKIIKTTFDNYKFDDGCIYPGVRASKLIEHMGMVDPESPQKEAHIDVFKYNLIGDDHVYVTGDARPMGFSKSANTANTEGKHVAKIIAGHAQGKEVTWVSPHTTCYSMVNADPMEAVSVDAGYLYDSKKKTFGFADVVMLENRDQAKGRATLEWAKGIYRDLFV